MIGYDRRYEYDESVARFSDRLRSGMPIDIINRLVRMESSQLKPWAGDDGKMWVAVYFVSKGDKSDRVLFVDAISEDDPIVEQLQDCWAEFHRLFPHIQQQIDAGRVIVSLQYER